MTGAAGNLGRAVAGAFAALGAKLVLVDLRPDGLKQAYGEQTERQLFAPADLLDQAQTDRAVKTAIERFGRIDVLCNLTGGFACVRLCTRRVVDERLVAGGLAAMRWRMRGRRSGAWCLVSAAITPPFAQENAEAAHQRWRSVADAARRSPNQDRRPVRRLRTR